MAIWDRFRRRKEETQEPGFFSRLFGRKEKPEEKKPSFFGRLFNRKKTDLEEIRRAEEEAKEAERLAREAAERAIKEAEEAEARLAEAQAEAERLRAEEVQRMQEQRAREETPEEMRARLLSEYKEEKRAEDPEKDLKDEDLEKRFDQFTSSYDTFVENFGSEGMSLQQFRDFVDVWGGITSDVRQAFGDSKDPNGDTRLVNLYMELPDSQRQSFPEYLQQIAREVEGLGYNQDERFNYLLRSLGK